jgi:hypothetical protein
VIIWKIYSETTYYPGVIKILAYLEMGKRLEKPKDCNQQLYEILLNCWDADPQDR